MIRNLPPKWDLVADVVALSQRDTVRTDWEYLKGDLAVELSLFTEWEQQARAWEKERPQ